MCRHRLMHRAIGNALSSSDVSDTDFGHRHVSEKTYADGGMWVGIKTMSQPIIDRKKYRQEVESLKADNRMKDMELGNGFVSKVDFVDLRRDSAMSESELSPLRSLLRQFRSNIARPLQEEVKDWLSPSSFAPRQIERARLRSVWRRFANGDSPVEECDTTYRRLPSQC